MNAATTHRELELSGAIHAIATAWPFVMTVSFDIEKANGDGTGTHWGRDQIVVVQMGPLALLPEPHDLLPAGASGHRVEIFSAIRFDRMPIETRERYRGHYRAFMLWRAALGADVAAKDLLAGVHYQPQDIATRVERWATCGLWGGDGE